MVTKKRFCGLLKKQIKDEIKGIEEYKRLSTIAYDFLASGAVGHLKDFSRDETKHRDELQSIVKHIKC